LFLEDFGLTAGLTDDVFKVANYFIVVVGQIFFNLFALLGMVEK